jgi:hypothetical protein
MTEPAVRARMFAGDRFFSWLKEPVPVLRLELVRIAAPLCILGFMSSRIAYADEWLGALSLPRADAEDAPPPLLRSRLRGRRDHDSRGVGRSPRGRPGPVAVTELDADRHFADAAVSLLPSNRPNIRSGDTDARDWRPHLLDVDLAHHAALGMLEDVAVVHPVAGLVEAAHELHRGLRRDDDRVLVAD